MNLGDEPFISRYFFCLNWSLELIMSSSGSVQNALEASFKILAQLVTCWIWAYIINRVGMILEEMNQNRSRQKREIHLITQYMENRKLSKFLQQKIINFLQYLNKGDQNLSQGNKIKKKKYFDRTLTL